MIAPAAQMMSLGLLRPDFRKRRLQMIDDIRERPGGTGGALAAFRGGNGMTFFRMS
jgi:hypothetical protein